MAQNHSYSLNSTMPIPTSTRGNQSVPVQVIAGISIGTVLLLLTAVVIFLVALYILKKRVCSSHNPQCPPNNKDTNMNSGNTDICV